MILIPITRLKFEEARERLTSEGVKFFQVDGAPPDTGRAESQGVKVSFHFQPQDGLLKIYVLAKPFMVPMDIVESKIREWFSNQSFKS